MKIDKLFKVTSEERMIKYYVREYENLINIRLTASSVAAGKRIDQGFTILDLTGGSMKIMSKKVYGFIKLASSVAQDYYPELLGR